MQRRKEVTEHAVSHYRPWKRAQAFLIETGWIGLAAAGLPIPIAVWSTQLGFVAPDGPLGGLLFFVGFVSGILALPLATLWATLAGAALLYGAVRAKQHAEANDVLAFADSGAYTLLNGVGLVVGAVSTAAAVLLVLASAT